MSKKREEKITVPDGGIIIGFDSNLIELHINQIVPLKIVGKVLQTSTKYKQIFPPFGK